MRLVKTVALAAAGAVLAACGTTSAEGASGSENGVGDLRVLVPNDPGGGLDTTARAVVAAMEGAGLASGVDVFNLPGAGGTLGLRRTAQEEGNAELLMMMGLGQVGAVVTNESESTFDDTTPLARMIRDQMMIAVEAGSEIDSIEELAELWREDPGSVVVGGGSSPGAPDHVLAMSVASRLGVDPKTVNYVEYDGAGEMLPALLGGRITVVGSSISEFADQLEAGDIRPLAVASAEPIEGIDAPTLMEEGVDFEFSNWRGFVAPPGITDEERERLIGLLEELHGSKEWQEALERNGWTDAFLTGDEFTAFINEQDDVVRQVLEDLDL